MEKPKKKNRNTYKNVSICRACLTSSQNLTPLNSIAEPNRLLTIREMLQTIVPLQMCSTTHVSQICAMCLSLLKIAYDFKLQLERSEKILRERDGNCIEPSEKNDEPSECEAIEIKKEPESSGAVDLICGNVKYDLKNILIIEEDTDVMEEHNYAGFLDNLGTEISADFVKDKAQRFEGNVEQEGQEEISIYINMPEPDAVEERAATSYQCEICGFMTNSKSAQRYHALKHKAPRFNCQICTGKSFLLAYKLAEHMKIYHNGERPFLCTVCGKGFPHYSSLAYHLKVHNGEKNYCCELCGDKFYLSGNLMRHMLTHTKERPHKCRYCDKSFPVKNQRTLHENTHLNIKPHPCKYCNRHFNRLSNLKYHYMTHSGTFACTVCSRSFVEAKFLTIHLKKTHNFSEQLRS